MSGFSAGALAELAAAAIAAFAGHRLCGQIPT